MEENDIHTEDKEYQELLLLNRERVYKKYGFESMLTEDEKAQLTQIKERGLTQFQKESLDNQSSRSYFLEELGNAQEQAQGGRKSIVHMKLERNKIRPVSDARDIAENILEISEESIRRSLMQDGIESVEEENKENEEKAEAIKDKKKDEQENVEESVLKLGTNLKQMRTDTDSFDDLDIEETQASFQEIAEDMNLLMEDLKGLKIDQEI